MSSAQWLRVSPSRLVNPAVAVCATLLALLVAEVTVRVLGRAPAIKVIELTSYDCIYRRSRNPILGFELKANYRNDTADFIQTYERTNSHGLRDRERTLEKPAAIRRVLLLGDSVVEGHGLPESEMISRQLEDLYDDGSTEVLNFGVSAYCTRAEIELLEVKGLQFTPDVVLLVFVENDFDNFNREAFPLGDTIDRPAVAKALFRMSHLFRLVSIQWNLFHFGAEADPVRWNQEAIGDNNVIEGLRRFRELADRHGFQPLVVIWPRFLNDRIVDVCFMPEGSEHLVVEHLAAIYDIPSVRLSEFFRRHHVESGSATNPRLRYTLGDELHPSREGARVAAEALRQILTDLSVGRLLSAREIPRSARSDAEAVAAAEALGRAKPDYARVHNRIGTELLKAGKLIEAVGEFEKAIAADPKHAGAYNNLGVTYEQLGREEAQTQFEHAIQQSPDFTQARFNLARVLMQKGHVAEAAVQLQHTIHIDPDHVSALNMLGVALGRHQKFAEAVSYLERAVRLEPNDAEVRSNLGAAYAGQGRLGEAIGQFEAALRIDPNDPQALENLRRVKAALQE